MLVQVVSELQFLNEETTQKKVLEKAKIILKQNYPKDSFYYIEKSYYLTSWLLSNSDKKVQ